MANSRARSSRPKRRRIILPCLLLVAAGLVGFLVLLSMSQVTGSEFSPDSFSLRSFSYRRIPGTRIVLNRIEYTDLDESLADYLTARKWLPPVTGNDDPRWDLVHDNRTNPASHVCDARYLTENLFGLSGNDLIAWSDIHPDLAAIFWPAVAKLARSGLYWAVPELLEQLQLGENGKQPTTGSFRVAVDAELARQFLNEGIDRLVAGDADGAIEALTISIETVPTAEAFSKRAKAYEKKGDSQASQSDRIQAAKLKKIMTAE